MTLISPMNALASAILAAPPEEELLLELEEVPVSPDEELLLELEEPLDIPPDELLEPPGIAPLELELEEELLLELDEELELDAGVPEEPLEVEDELELLELDDDEPIGSSGVTPAVQPCSPIKPAEISNSMFLFIILIL